MFGRFRYNNNVFYGEVKDNMVTSPEGSYMEYDLSELEILPPSQPSKIICVGLNYHDHATELGLVVSQTPILFLKPPSSVIGHNGKILYPKVSNRVDFEAELAVIIGKKCKSIAYDRAYDVIAGFTCFNDITARDLQQKDGQWTRAKCFDTFAPVGPYIAPVGDFNPENASIISRVNSDIRQNSNISRLIFDIPYLIEFISGIMTLEIGDIIATGTPPGVGELHKGDMVEVEIEGIGTLKNEVV